MQKFAVFSHTFPPQSNGQSVVLGRILNGLPADEFCLVSGTDGPTPSLPGAHHRLTPAVELPRPKPLRVLIDPLNLRLRLQSTRRQLARILHEESCEAIVACTGEMHELPAAWLAARDAGIRFVAYVFDWYRCKYQLLRGWHGRRLQAYARRIEGPMLRDADAVIVPNETLQEVYRQEYGVTAHVVRNPTDFEPIESPPRRRNELQICYTGAIYQAHIDAFDNLISALPRVKTTPARLVVYSDAASADLAKFGLKDGFELRPRVSLEQVRDVQRNADVLFLPLAFHSEYPEIVRTSAPGKLGDYLASGRPILVHAPPDSYPAWLFRKHDCGLLVTEDSVDAVAAALQKLADDPALGTRWAANAAKLASREFSVPAARQAFVRATELSQTHNRSISDDQRAA